MKTTLIGLTQSGKSTVFSAVTGMPVDLHAPREPRHAVVPVPDARLDELAKLCKPKKITHATTEFVDVPGCALDDAKGREEWRRLLPEVRQADLLAVVVGEFEDAAAAGVDPAADFNAIWEEMVFADLDAVTGRVERLEKAMTKPTKTHDAEKRELDLLKQCQAALEAGEPLSSVITTEERRRQVSSFAFVTEKPLLVIRNIADDAREVGDWSVSHARATLTLRAAIESEIAQLPAEDRPAFMAEMGLESSTLDRLIQKCYEACGLISFLTMGPDEVRAWTIPKGATALDAAAKIHTDLARGFIRAETVAYDDLMAHGDMKGAKAAGRVRKEGKTYVVADGDVLLILANP